LLKTIIHGQRYCVFGNPIEHSKSPEIHAAFAAQTGQDLEYTRELVELDAFPATAKAFLPMAAVALTSPCLLNKRPVKWRLC
jgi:shikimate dehydrogenase (EC 1.1.1.25)